MMLDGDGPLITPIEQAPKTVLAGRKVSHANLMNFSRGGWKALHLGREDQKHPEEIWNTSPGCGVSCGNNSQVKHHPVCDATAAKETKV